MKFFGYVVVCDGCCVDLRYDGGGDDWKSCTEKVTASSPHYNSRKDALEAGQKVVKRKQAGFKAAKTQNGRSWSSGGKLLTEEELARIVPNSYRVFVYEMREPA